MELFRKEIINRIGKILIEKAENIAIAESVTAGYLQAAIASADDAIHFFQGGITAYNIGQKARHLLIEPIHAVACNCVSQQVATEMALNVCTLFNSDWGIGITGYASPVPESDNKVYCHYAIAHNNEIVAGERIEGLRDKNAFEIQVAYVNEVIQRLLNYTGNKNN